MQSTITELKKLIVTGEGIPRKDKATSPLDSLPLREDMQRAGLSRKSREKERDLEYSEVVLRPALKGVQMPIPQYNPDKIIATKLKDEDAELSRQIVELVSRRKELRQTMNKLITPVAEGEIQKRSGSKPRIVSNVQVAPPRNEFDHQAELHERETRPNMEWQKVEDKSKRKKKKKLLTPTIVEGETARVINPKVGSQAAKPAATDKRIKRKPPKTAAVNIKGLKEGFSYAEALKNLRGKIALADLDIGSSRVRKAVGGGLIIEISGDNKVEKAEKLKSKISEVLGDTARVTRPVTKGELRLVGIDDSVVTEEVADTIAMLGGCKSQDVRVGTIRPMSNGLFTVWAQCPLEAAIKASQQGKVKIGWTVARIDLLKSRPIQCYKCWGHGHLRTQCRSEVDRSRTCYRCGREGHLALNCINPVHCILCAAAGKNADHRVGSGPCKVDLTKEPEQSRQKETQQEEDMLVDEPEGGSGIEDRSDA